MAVPKSKKSKAKRNSKRNSNITSGIKEVNVSFDRSGKVKLQHYANDRYRGK